MSVEDHDRQSDLAVMDANEYKQKRRLERILDAHDNVEEQANEAWFLYVQNEISEEARDITILRAVKQFIRECYNLLLEYRRDNFEDLDAEDEIDPYWTGDPTDDPLGVIQRREGENKVFWGLRDILDAKSMYYDEWTETTTDRHGTERTVTHTERYTVDIQTSWRAYLRLREFLDTELDMEITFEELEDTLPDDKPREVDLPPELDAGEVDAAEKFEGPVDARAVMADAD